MFKAILKSVGLLLLYMIIAGGLLTASFSPTSTIDNPALWGVAFNGISAAVGVGYMFRSRMGRLRAFVIAAPTVFVALTQCVIFMGGHLSTTEAVQLKAENPVLYIEKAHRRIPLFQYLDEAKGLGGPHLSNALELTMKDVGSLKADEARRLRDFIKSNKEQIGAATKSYLKLVEARISELNTAEKVRAMEDNPESFLAIKKFDWKIDGFGTVMIANFQIANTSTLTMKDLGILCDLFGESGTRLSSASTTVFQVFKAGKTKSLKEVNMGFITSQTARASCKVNSAVVVR